MIPFKTDLIEEARSSFIDGNYKVAEPILQQLIFKNTKNPEVYQMLATIFYDQGKFTKAIQTFKRALEIDPTYTDASVGLSIILNDLGKYEEGREVFEKAQGYLEERKQKKDPYIDEKIASKHEELADLYFQHKRFDEALEQLLISAKLSTRKPEIQMRIAEVYIQMGNPELAIQGLRQLLKEYPGFNLAKMKLGLVYYNNNNIAAAVDQWEAVLAKDPRHAEANRYLKMAQMAGITSLEI